MSGELATKQAKNRPDASPLNGQVPPVEHRWQPGQSGNPAGRPRERPIAAAIRDVLERDDGQAVLDIAETAVAKARQGDFRFFRELLQLIDERPATPPAVETDEDREEWLREVVLVMRRQEAARHETFCPGVPTIAEIMAAREAREADRPT